MKSDKIILKFDALAEQVHGPVKRLIGFVSARSMLGLFDAADLEANPRSAKAGPVTEAIFQSIDSDPDVFPFKTKGILIGCSEYELLQRQRVELRFGDPRIEGVLDGGHNMLAIGKYMLWVATGDEKLLKRLKLWEQFKEAWAENRPAIDEVRDELNFLVPIEVLVPAEATEEVISEFRSGLLDICAARNNNAELTLETKANQKGFYEAIKQALPKAVTGRIEWKSNAAGTDIKVRDIIALSWIPLRLIDLPRNVKAPAPQSIYGNKGECAKLFDELMSNPSVSRPTNGAMHELHDPAVRSAIRILGDLPVLYDKIYAEFPAAYNKVGDFGRMGVVRIYEAAKKGDKNRKYLRSQSETHFTEKPVKYSYPDGFIVPLVYGLVALMEVRDGEVAWKVDPAAFLDQHLPEIARAYRMVLEMAKFDPQKIGKSETSYDFAVGEFEKALLKQGAVAA